jgi:hypothetical protein
MRAWGGMKWDLPAGEGVWLSVRVVGDGIVEGTAYSMPKSGAWSHSITLCGQSTAKSSQRSSSRSWTMGTYCRYAVFNKNLAQSYSRAELLSDYSQPIVRQA